MIQSFIHTYIQDKKKTEKIHMVVGHAFEQFLMAHGFREGTHETK